MPKRVIDFDAMWGSDKLAACAEWAQAEYAWLYGLADASGCFELTNLRVIWGRVAAVRKNLSIERLEEIFREFQEKGLLFVWEQDGKRYAHWTGSDVPGRLPPPSWRMRLERFAPAVPRKEFAEYVSRFARGRGALGSGGFRAAERGAACGVASTAANIKTGLPVAPDGSAGLKDRVEEAQGQDWNLELDENSGMRGKWSSPGERMVGGGGERAKAGSSFSSSEVNRNTTPGGLPSQSQSREENRPGGNAEGAYAAGTAAAPAPRFYRYRSEKEEILARELAVGLGPPGPVRVKPEVLERIRARDEALRAKRASQG